MCPIQTPNQYPGAGPRSKNRELNQQTDRSNNGKRSYTQVIQFNPKSKYYSPESKPLTTSGLTWDMQKVGWIRSGLGNWSRTIMGLTTLQTGNGPMNRGANFWLSNWSGRSAVKSHTCCPTLYTGAVVFIRVDSTEQCRTGFPSGQMAPPHRSMGRRNRRLPLDELCGHWKGVAKVYGHMRLWAAWYGKWTKETGWGFSWRLWLSTKRTTWYELLVVTEEAWPQEELLHSWGSNCLDSASA